MKDFEDLGFEYSEDFSDKEAENFRYKLVNKHGDILTVSQSLYILVCKFPECKSSAILQIASTDSDDLIDVGHGIKMPRNGISNLYKIAEMLSKNEGKTFITCLPEELWDEIEKQNLVVLLNGGGDANAKNESGKWKWAIEIISPSNEFDNTKGNLYSYGASITLGFKPENDGGSGIIYTDPAYAIGDEGLEKYPEFKDIYNKLIDEMEKDGNSFDPETLQATLTPEAIQAIKDVLPYLNKE